MPLRLFGGGSEKVRACPACEHEIAAQATFCPSCYMVFRPEGAAELRKYLHGSRVPADVYLLRKMQTEDPNTGPVIRVSPEAQSVPPPAEIAAPALTEPALAPETPAPKFQTLRLPCSPLCLLLPSPPRRMLRRLKLRLQNCPGPRPAQAPKHVPGRVYTRS